MFKSRQLSFQISNMMWKIDTEEFLKYLIAKAL